MIVDTVVSAAVVWNGDAVVPFVAAVAVVVLCGLQFVGAVGVPCIPAEV